MTISPTEEEAETRLSQASLLPPGRTTLSLSIVIAVMCALATLAIIATAMAMRMSSNWLDDLAHTATVQLRPVASMTAEEQSTRSISILQNHEAVLSANLLGIEETRKLLEPWLGKDAAIGDLPLPQLVAVRMAPEFDDFSDLVVALQDVPGAKLDSHENTRSAVSRLGQGVEVSSLIIVLLVVAALISTIAFATRASVESHRSIVEVLHLIGASDHFVARQFENHFMKMGLIAGVVGMAAALLIAGLFGLLIADTAGNTQYLLPRLTLTSSDILLALTVPLGAGAIGWATARFAVLNILAGRP